MIVSEPIVNGLKAAVAQPPDTVTPEEVSAVVVNIWLTGGGTGAVTVIACVPDDCPSGLLTLAVHDEVPVPNTVLAVS